MTMKESLETFEDTQDAEAAVPDTMTCRRCGSRGLGSELIKIAFWRDGGLIVIRNIPAMVCQTCGEEYVGDRTVLDLDRMRGDRFEGHAVSERMIVPVIDFEALSAADKAPE